MSRNWFAFDFAEQAPPPRFHDGERTGGPEHPFAEFVSADKNGAAYYAHSYPTKVPAAVIAQFITYYTAPGDVVLDPFCGSGMTGLAARRAGRNALLSDLSPLAIHLAYNHATPCDARSLVRAWHEIQTSLRDEIQELYGIACDNCHCDAQLRYAIWSDVYACPCCGREHSLWRTGTDQARGTVASTLTCTSCGRPWRRSADSRVTVEPAWLAYSCSCTSRSLRQRAPVSQERDRIASSTRWETDLWYPTVPVDEDREMYKRSALQLRGIKTVADFYTPRNLAALALLWNEIGRVEDQRVRLALAFAFTNTAWHGTRMRRYNARGGHRPLTGTLFIPQLSSEANVFHVFGNKVRQLARFYRELPPSTGSSTDLTLRVGSATSLDWIPDGSVDYVFTDPPFGSNIFYADCNLIMESWLGRVTELDDEAVINRSRDPSTGGKTLDDYQALLTAAFAEIHRVLKPQRWATVVFQSSDGEVWQAIEAAAREAGFVLGKANGIDKGQESMKGYKGRSGAENVASFDVVLHLRKGLQDSAWSSRRLEEDELEEFVLPHVRDHLAALDASTTSERTLPYLYSLLLRKLLNAGVSPSGFSMQKLRTILTDRLVERSGCWYSAESGAVPQAAG